MQGCSECAPALARDDRFCESCGTNLRLRTASTTTESRPPAGPCAGCGEPAPEPGPGAGPDGYCPGCGLLCPDGTERVELDAGALAGVSDRGHAHARNEDAAAVGGDATLAAAVVCDGISHGHRPELASRAAVDAALDELLGADAAVPGARRARRAVEAASRAVAGVGSPRGTEPASCTLVCATVAGEPGGPVDITVGWVGDSRAYWLAEPGAAEPSRLLTTDHSWAVEQVAAGAMDAVSAANHELAHAITRWVGPDIEPELDVVTLRPAGPGLLMLCSDGLWNYRPEAAELAATVLPRLADRPLAAARELTTVALDAGGRDNVTVVVVPVRTDTERSPS